MQLLARLCALVFLAVPAFAQTDDVPSVTVGIFDQEIAHKFTTEKGLPSNDVHNVAVDDGGIIYAATAMGLARSVAAGNAFEEVPGFTGMPIQAVSALADTVLVVHGGGIYDIGNPNEPLVVLPPEARAKEGRYRVVRAGNRIYISTAAGLYRYAYREDLAETPLLTRTYALEEFLGDDRAIVDLAVSGKGDIAVAANGGLFYSYDVGETWKAIEPAAGDRSWAPRGVGGVAFNDEGNLWFGSRQGVGLLEWDWTLFTGDEGLPYNDFTCAIVDDKGRPWFGTTLGATYYVDGDWRYRQGERWLPADDVRDMAVDAEGRVWFATSGGLGRISFIPMTLAEKAEYYEDEIDEYHRRTEYEFVLEVGVREPGVKEGIQQGDSDNDGLWTSMYGAGECFAYAATGDPKAKERAIKAFEAMEFLGKVTQGGSNPPPKGYVARTVLPTSGPNPNDGRYERDVREQEDDYLWKAYEPRWPTSEDGKWYWKSDTSSDELDGHYFLYALFYDLVADTEELKERVRVHIANLTNHFIDNGYNLVDHDGTPTRWGRFSPEELNFSKNWFVERGLNSLSMLSYLRTTAHITGDAMYHEAADKLIEDHSYAQNLMYPKFQHGVGTGNQSDDEMAFMTFYNLLKYEPNEELRSRYAASFWQYWRLEQPELNPFFNFAFAAVGFGATFTDPWGTYDLAPVGNWLEESVETLKRFPLDRFNWAHQNSHRIDIERLPAWSEQFDRVGSHATRGMRTTGAVLPVDERHFNHWNTDSFDLDYGGAGNRLADGAVYLLPYYMGLYHGFIEESDSPADTE